MKKSRLSEERIIEVLRQLEAGRKVSQLKRLKEIEEENRRLKTLVADLSLDKVALNSVIKKTDGAGRTMRGGEARHRVLLDERAAFVSSTGAVDRSSHRYRPQEKRREELCARLRQTRRGASALWLAALVRATAARRPNGEPQENRALLP